MTAKTAPKVTLWEFFQQLGKTFIGFQLTVARWRILRFPLSESTLNFRIFLFNRTGCLCEVIHIRRVDGGAL